MESVLPALEGEVLTNGLPGKSPELTFRLFGSSTVKNIIVAVIVCEGIFVFWTFTEPKIIAQEVQALSEEVAWD